MLIICRYGHVFSLWDSIKLKIITFINWRFYNFWVYEFTIFEPQQICISLVYLRKVRCVAAEEQLGHFIWFVGLLKNFREVILFYLYSSFLIQMFLLSIFIVGCRLIHSQINWSIKSFVQKVWTANYWMMQVCRASRFVTNCCYGVCKLPMMRPLIESGARTCERNIVTAFCHFNIYFVCFDPFLRFLSFHVFVCI